MDTDIRREGGAGESEGEWYGERERRGQGKREGWRGETEER